MEAIPSLSSARLGPLGRWVVERLMSILDGQSTHPLRSNVW